MNFKEKFIFSVGILLLCQGILGIIFFSLYGGMGYIVIGILLIISGIIPLLICIRPPESMPAPPSNFRDFILFAIPFLSFGFLFLFHYYFLGFSLHVLYYYYLSGLLLSWGFTAITWVLLKKLKEFDKEFEPKLDINEYSKIQEEEIKQDLKSAGINPAGQIQMIIKKVGYSDPVYARKVVRGWPWRAKGRIILTDKELIFLSVKKKNINFTIALSEISAIQSFSARSGALSYQWCEIIYGIPKVSAVFMTWFYSDDIYSTLLQKTLQEWYNKWVEGV